MEVERVVEFAIGRVVTIAFAVAAAVVALAFTDESGDDGDVFDNNDDDVGEHIVAADVDADAVVVVELGDIVVVVVGGVVAAVVVVVKPITMLLLI